VNSSLGKRSALSTASLVLGSDSDSDDKGSLQARGDLGLQMNYAFQKYRHFLAGTTSHNEEDFS
jgi:hypothetical protein